ncbi:MAG: HlyD family efflux transporter periplasmic adaptor subunit, partial [Bacteriovoracaceae bacterium]|nr:HlyD family efflux transporter periplasmic adaptor subunit [Bacteriovoracaceae bacterium]
NSQGQGQIIALNPNDRVQQITALVSGRVEKWFAEDGAEISKGDPIVEIVDNDPNFQERLKTERDAQLSKYNAVKIAAETALKNYKRQKDLLSEGLTSQVKVEKAQITYKKLLSEEATAAASLAKAEVNFARQQSQLILAPSDGTVLRVKAGGGNMLVSEGQEIATFVPTQAELVAEIYIDGNDIPLVYPGRNVRLQFEGWPAVQFSGWPSVAIGTFPGTIHAVDMASAINGKFRVLIKPTTDGRKWPSATFLRQGTRVFAWILLDEVKLGYELWRKFNGFPLSATQLYLDEIEYKNVKGKKKKKDK